MQDLHTVNWDMISEPPDCCRECGGDGYVEEECPDCLGAGCQECGDTGTVSVVCGCMDAHRADEY